MPDPRNATTRPSDGDPASPLFWRQYAERMTPSFGPGGRALGSDCWDRAASTYDDLEACPDYQRQRETILSTLRERGCLEASRNVLDVGAGTGTYSMPMARLCKRVVSLDISGAMLDELASKQRKAKLSNIERLRMDFRDYHPGERFDLVFASMTPLLHALDNVDRMMAISSRFVALVSWAGVRQNILFDELFEDLTGKPPEPPGSDAALAFNYLHAQGYSPEMRFFHGCWERTRSVDAQVASLLWRIEMFRPLNDPERQRVRDHVERLARDDRITSWTKVRIGFIFVDKEASAVPCPPQ